MTCSYYCNFIDFKCFWCFHYDVTRIWLCLAIYKTHRTSLFLLLFFEPFSVAFETLQVFRVQYVHHCLSEIHLYPLINFRWDIDTLFNGVFSRDMHYRPFWCMDFSCLIYGSIIQHPLALIAKGSNCLKHLGQVLWLICFHACKSLINSSSFQYILGVIRNFPLLLDYFINWVCMILNCYVLFDKFFSR